jgi:hypothetical protein
MSEVARQVAEVLLPFASAAGGAVATGMAEQAGADVLASAKRLLKRLDPFRRSAGPVDAEALASAIITAVDAGDLSEDELRQFLAMSRTDATVATVVAKNSFVGSTINVARDMNL